MMIVTGTIQHQALRTGPQNRKPQINLSVSFHPSVASVESRKSWRTCIGRLYKGVQEASSCHRPWAFLLSGAGNWIVALHVVSQPEICRGPKLSIPPARSLKYAQRAKKITNTATKSKRLCCAVCFTACLRPPSP